MLDTLLATKQNYQNIITEQYKDAVFIELDELIELHSIHNPKHFTIVFASLRQFKASKTTAVAYVLGAGIATDENHCCNGIRYGIDGDYISLPQLPSHVWVPF